MNSPKIQVRLSGHITLSKSDLDRILGYGDAAAVHTGLVYSIHMGFVDSEEVEFELPDDYKQG